MLHAITPDGPLCERDDEGYPVDDLVWKGDVPHSKNRNDNKKTAELLWKATSSTGDYHDNMNSEMFMKWIENKFIPTFDAIYKGKKAVLVLDNAPYHHKRSLGSFAKLKKEDLVNIMIQHEVKYLDIPMTVERFEACDNDDVSQDLEESCRVFFNKKLFLERSSSTKPLIPTLDEMKLALVEYIQINLPHLLECRVESYLKERGHHILWTPPYTPDLQPIETFWASGKNHAARLCHAGIKMKETVANVREGWYGSKNQSTIIQSSSLPLTYKNRNKKPANCNAMFMRAIKMANEKFIPLCPALSGQIGSLIIDETHQANLNGLPVDMVINDITKQEMPDEVFI